jgi:hypothetical protein
MNGKIYFPDLKSLAEFLKEFGGSTAIFKVESGQFGQWVLSFNGGY